jgi:hypothetical protein
LQESRHQGQTTPGLSVPAARLILRWLPMWATRGRNARSLADGERLDRNRMNSGI